MKLRAVTTIYYGESIALVGSAAAARVDLTKIHSLRDSFFVNHCGAWDLPVPPTNLNTSPEW